MVIDEQLLNLVTAQAKTSPRLRLNYDLRNSSEDKSQRMLNAVEPGTHLFHSFSHSTKSITFVGVLNICFDINVSEPS